MSRRSLKIVSLFAAVLLSATTLIALGQTVPDSIKSIIQKEVANRRSKSIIVGLVTVKGTQIISAGWLSDTNPQLPDGNTLYEIGSLTKVFTSLLLADMSLHQQLNLTDPVSRFLPADVRVPEKNGKEITLFHLATHTAGFPRMPDNLDPKNEDNPLADYTVRQLYQYISAFQLSHDMGSLYQYSNTGYGLLGYILSLVARKDFETLAKEKICTPLHMNSTVVLLTPALKKNMAGGYSEYGKGVANWDLPVLAGAGALRSTVNDLLLFAAAYLGFIKTDLAPAMVLCSIPQVKKDGNEGFVTLGWTGVNDGGKELLWKDGATGGYRSFIGLDKKGGTGIVILSNSFNDIKNIGLHILDSTYAIKPYQYKWALLDTIDAAIKTEGVDRAMKLYRQLKTSGKPEYVFDENILNYLGNNLRRVNNLKSALKIHLLNVKEHPGSALAYQSLGETYRQAGDNRSAIESFEKLLRLNPQNAHAIWMLKKLKAKK